MAYQIGYANDYYHFHYLLRLFLTGAGIPPENGAVAGTGNTGDGTVDRIHGTNSTVTETWTLSFSDATNFTVTGSVSGAQAAGVVGTPYTNTFIEFEVTAGGTPFAASDSFTIDMVANPLETSGKWKIERENATEALNAELALQAPGNSGLDVAPFHYFGLDIPSATVPYMRIISHSEFTVGNTFYGQVGYSGGNSPSIQLADFKMKYWFMANAKRCLMLVRVYDRYFTGAFGILDAYATEAQWPQPHFIAGSSYGGFNWENPDARIMNFPGSSANANGDSNTSMRIFRPDLLWQNMSSWYSTGDQVFAETTVADVINVWPWGERAQFNTGGTAISGNFGGPWKYLVEGPDGTFPLVPVQYYRREGASQAIYGTVEGVYATTGGYTANETSVQAVEDGATGTFTIKPTRLSNEDIITVGADRYICFPLIPMTRRRGHWAAFKLE